MSEQEKEAEETTTISELETLKKEATDFKDKYFRLLAEQENLRKRLFKERDDYTRHATRAVIRDFLTPIDQMESALGFAKGMSEDVKHWALGFQMILEQFKDALASQGVTAMECIGEHFDPHFHHVTETLETDEQPEGTIIKESMKGYMMDGEPLRAAHVVIAKNKKES